MEIALTEFNRSVMQSATDSASLAAADQRQSLNPRDVVEDYFARAGLADNLGDVVIVKDDNGRSVTMEPDFEQLALLTRVAGIESWEIPVDGGAIETVGDIEIAVVFDNSTSMSRAPGSTSGPAATPSRMDRLPDQYRP